MVRISKKPAFTLIELLVTISISMILISTTVAGYNTFNERQKLKQSSLTLKNVLRLAQTKANSAQKPNSEECTDLVGYQVMFDKSGDPGRELYFAELYGVCNTADPIFIFGQRYYFPMNISLRKPIPSDSLPDPILFLTLNQGVVNPPTIRIHLNSPDSDYSLKIESNGEISDD